MLASSLTDAPFFDSGILTIRSIAGLLMAGHGAQKLFGWFGGHGLAGTAGFFEQLGYRPARLFAALAAASEIVSGLLITLGLLGPIGPALWIALMIVAAVTVHWKHGIFSTTNGIELPLLFGVIGFTLALTGYGQYSLDAAFNLTPFWTPTVIWGAIVAGVIGGIANLAVRRTNTVTTA